MPIWLDTTIHILAVLTMLVGLFGLIVPIFPGNVVMWLAALTYGLIFGFGRLGGVMFAIITVLMIAAVLADNVLMGAKAREKGAAWGSIILALIAGVAGTMLLPPVGGLIAAPLALYLMELQRLGDADEAKTVVKALLIGWGLAFIVRFGLGVVMFALWGIWAYFG
ncbi:MAG: DUF456 domain-containing protein [Anaerolineales bacterium]|nr:DUF456 domain-containing protein [Anaerolineales bacterium]